MRAVAQTLFLAALLFVGSLARAAGDVALSSGGRLTISRIAYTRSLPHAFFDQAMSSLPRLYPGHELLAGRRTGLIGEVAYALVCYRESPSSEHAVIQAVAVFEGQAWNLDAIAPLPYGDTLVEVLERIGHLSSDPGARRAPASGRR